MTGQRCTETGEVFASKLSTDTVTESFGGWGEAMNHPTVLLDDLGTSAVASDDERVTVSSGPAYKDGTWDTVLDVDDTRHQVPFWVCLTPHFRQV